MRLLAIVSLLVLLLVGFFVYRLLDTEPLPQLVLSQEKTEGAAQLAEPSVSSGRATTCIRILAIDGGGIRGVVPALILSKIEELTKRPIAEQFDVVAGTSTGALIALGLTRPDNHNARKPALSAADLVNLYVQHGSSVFPNPASPFGKFRQLFRPKYAGRGISDILDRYFEDVVLIEALTAVLIPAYDIEENRRIWFDSSRGSAHHILMKDIVRGATAAPTYLPPARFAVPVEISKRRYVAVVDGALFANNPAIEALSFADALMGRDDIDRGRSVLLVSLGTGRQPVQYTFEQAWTWGLLGWAKPLLEIAYNDPAIDRMAESAVKFRGGHYERLQVDALTDLDDSSPEGVQRLVDATKLLLEQEKSRVEHIAYQLSLPRSERCARLLGANYVRPDGPREVVRRKEQETERERLRQLHQRQASEKSAARAVETMKPLEAFRECPECPEMVILPVGEFKMGSPESEEGRLDDEGPQQRITMAKPFAVSKYEVSWDEWDACFASGSCQHRPDDHGWGRGRRPVMGVSWEDAQAYVKWLSEKTGKPYRLLTEPEWEYAARAGKETAFWWGSSIFSHQANYNGEIAYGGGPKGEYRKKTMPVDAFDPNPWGLHQMNGNVSEWVEECRHYSYAGLPTDGSPWPEGDCRARMVRGGAIHDEPAALRSAARLSAEPHDRGGAYGIRVARTITR